MKLIIILILILPFFFSCKQNETINNTSKIKNQEWQSYENASVKPFFIPLLPGEIRPEGWIKDWATSALSGITGHLDEWNPTFGEAWKGVGFEARGADPEDGTGWPLEQCAYWLDGAVRLAYIMNDSALIRKVSARLDKVVDGVNNGGETFIFWKPRSFVENDGFNSWAHSHMGRALVAYYRATGDQRILNALVKVYNQFPLPSLPDYFDRVTGAVNVDPMIDTYLMSGDQQILERIISLSKDSSFIRVIEEWNKEKINNGHGVITYENIRVPVQVYPWTGESQHLQATKSCFNWLDHHHMLPVGIASSEEHTAGIGSTRNVETCNVAASAWSYQKLYEIDGDNRWGDHIEQIFFNAVPAPVDRDFQTMCYYQSPNRIGNLVPGEDPKHPSETGMSAFEFRPTGHDVLCCVGNLNRAIPNYIMHMWMATFDGGLAATLYGPSVLNTTIGNGIPVTIVSETDYPFNEKISLAFDLESKVEFPLYLRIPGWCKSPLIQVNGEQLNETVKEHGFVKVFRSWESGDKLEIHFPMSAKLITGYETAYPQSGYFQEGGNRELTKLTAIHNPYESIQYGPLLFALPLKDIDANTQAPGEKWNYALNIDEENMGESVNVTREAIPDYWKWQLDAPLKLKVKAKSFDWFSAELQPLPEHKIKDGENVEIELVPYGCTKFRVSMFPVAN